MKTKEGTGRISRRGLVQGATAIGVVGALGTPFVANARGAAELRILFPGGSWKDWFSHTFAEPFTKAHGTRFIWKIGINDEPLVLAQRRRPQWDLVHANQEMAAQMGALRAVIEWQESRIPNLGQIYPAFRFKYLAGVVNTPYGLAWNTKKINRQVTSWWDLWDPAFTGKAAFPAWDWVGEDVFYAINALAGGSVSNINPGMEKMQELFHKNKAQIINDVEQTKQLLVSQDVWICPYFGARTRQAKQAGAPVEFVLPKEGGLSWIWDPAIIAGRPASETELAEEFINTTLDAEKQIAFSRLTGYPPTNIHAIDNLPPDLKHLAISKADLEAMAKLQKNFNYLEQFKNRSYAQGMWDKEVLGS